MRFIPCALLLILSFSVLSNTKASPDPVVIQGQLLNFPPGKGIVFFKDVKKDYKDYIIDNVDFDSTGRFYFKTSSVTEPVLLTLRRDSLSVDLYVAPGYELTLTGDVSNMREFQQHKRVKGKGAQPNRYLLMMDSINWSEQENTPRYELKGKELLAYARKRERISDSLFQLTFKKKDLKDPAFETFARMTRIDIQSMAMYYIIEGVLNDTTLTYNQSVAFFEKNVNKTFLASLYDNKNLVSGNYVGWLMGTYPYYLRELAIRKNPAYRNDREADIQWLEQVSLHYKNKIRDIRLYTKMTQLLSACGSFQDLTLYKDKFAPYIAALTSPADRSNISEAFTRKESELKQTEAGKPAPAFTVSDSTGTTHTLAQYAGKVVYIDLWASWCVPCRAEQPFMKALVEKYKDNNSLAILSIGVLDKYNSWKKAVIKDKPTWPQLYDKNKELESSYFVYAIPKFILINRKGEIISFSAPLPSNAKELEEMLNKELAN